MRARTLVPMMCAVGSSVLSTCLVGCLADPHYAEPTTLVAPYEATQLWAVVPFQNESGVSEVDGTDVADLFADQAADITGVHVIPVNRVIRALAYLDMERITTAGDARLVMNVLDVDGLIVGTITSWDPYRPPVLGLAIQLHRREDRTRAQALDTIALTRSPADRAAPGALEPDNPVADAAGVFDASNHRTLQQLDAYATGRVEPDTAFGRDIYLVSMDLYTQFVSHRLLADLLDAEWEREMARHEDPPPGAAEP